MRRELYYKKYHNKRRKEEELAWWLRLYSQQEGRRFESYSHRKLEGKIMIYYQEREERLPCERKLEGSSTLVTIL